MRRRDVLLGTGTVLTAGVAGCIGGTDGGDGTDGSDGSADAEVLANETTATPGDTEPRRVVTVSGSGEVRGDPDRARVSFEIRARADKARTVRDDLATRAEQVRSALLETGLDEADITTTEFRIDEQIDHRKLREADVDPDSPEARERFRFYEGSHTFEVELDDVEAVGSTIDAAVGAGADEVDRVVFTLSDEKRRELREQALREAVQNARSEAEAVADEVGAEVVEATVVDASRGRIGPVERSGDAALAATPTPQAAGDGGSATGVEPGDVTVSVDVDVRFTME